MAAQDKACDKIDRAPGAWRSVACRDTAQRRKTLLHLALEIVFGPPERLVAGADEVALLFAQASNGLLSGLCQDSLVSIVDLAVEAAQIGIGADRLFDGLARRPATEGWQQPLRQRVAAVALLADLREIFRSGVRLRIDAERL